MNSELGTPAYQNDRYWTQRLEREFTLAGVGHAGVGLAFNQWAYRVRRRVLLRTLRQFNVPITGACILELGFGTGFYLDLWRQLGAAHVTGFDITDIAVGAARERFAAPASSMNDTTEAAATSGGGPDALVTSPVTRHSSPAAWRFEKADIGAPLPLGEAAGHCDLATAFDVLFHLVEDRNWNGALDNIAAALKPGGHALIFDKYQSIENSISHVRRRTLDAYRQALAARGFEVLAIRPIFFLMNSPTDLSGPGKLLFKTFWSLAKAPYKIGKHIGLGDVLGGAVGASLYPAEILLGRIFSSGPSTKLLLARKK